MKNSRYFKVDNQPRLEQIIRSLSIRANAEILGRAFQGHAAVRQITQNNHQILSIAAKNLELETRARLLPEEKLEASLLLGDEQTIEELLQEEKSGIAEKRRQYLYRQAPTRNKIV